MYGGHDDDEGGGYCRFCGCDLMPLGFGVLHASDCPERRRDPRDEGPQIDDITPYLRSLERDRSTIHLRERQTQQAARHDERVQIVTWLQELATEDARDPSVEAQARSRLISAIAFNVMAGAHKKM